MIRDPKAYEKFEREFISESTTAINEKFRLLDTMYYKAVQMGVFPLKNPLDSIDTIIKIAMVINSVPISSEKDHTD